MQSGVSELIFAKTGARAPAVEDTESFDSEKSKQSKGKRRDAKYVTSIINHNSLNVNFVE
jgi:hypothetical protein